MKIEPHAGRSRTDRLARAISIAASALALFVSLTGCSPQGDSKSQTSATPSNVTLTVEQRQHIHLVTVMPATFHRTIETTGSVDFDNDQATSVLAPFSGPVSRLFVSPGQRVRKGEPLAAVESPDFATAVSAYRKALATAQTARRLADVDKDLVQHQGVSQREQQQAETDAVNAEADRDAALQTIDSLDIDPQTIAEIRNGRPVSRIDGIIRSPIAGTVVEKSITPGQLLQAGTTPCFTVANISRIWVMAQVFGSDLASVSVGDRARVATGVASESMTGAVDNIAAEIDPNTRSATVRVAVANPQGLLKKQMYVRVAIEAQQEITGLLVPVSAILRDDENLPFVYVQAHDGSFARRHVTLGDRSSERYDIVAGLAAGDRVVVDGAIFVQFMQDQ